MVRRSRSATAMAMRVRGLRRRPRSRRARVKKGRCSTSRVPHVRAKAAGSSTWKRMGAAVLPVRRTYLFP